VNVFGDDLDVLDTTAQEIAGVLRDTPGAVDVRVGAAATAPHVAVRLDAEALQRRVFQPADVFETVETAFAGTTAGQLHRGEQPIDVVVSLPPAERTDPLTVGDVLVENAAGAVAPLRTLAAVEMVAARDAVRHEGGRRRQTVTSGVEGRDLTSFVADLDARLAARVQMPSGTYRTIAGTAAAREQATRDLIVHAAFGFAGVLLLLAIVAEHWRNLALLLVNLPLALAGGVVAVAATGIGLSLGALVGFV